MAKNERKRGKKGHKSDFGILSLEIGESIPTTPYTNGNRVSGTSKCCHSIATLNICPDFTYDRPDTMTVGTCFCVCSKCGKVCDVIFKRSPVIGH